MAEGARGRTSDILLDVLAKELRVLRDEAGVHVEAAQVDVGEPHAVQRDLPARRRVEVHEKVDQRRLSAAALAHKCHGRATLDAQVDTYPSQIGRRPALFLDGCISPIFSHFFSVFSLFSPS